VFLETAQPSRWGDMVRLTRTPTLWTGARARCVGMAGTWQAPDPATGVAVWLLSHQTSRAASRSLPLRCARAGSRCLSRMLI
jgi:CubicO group peptidase (beta-lactamase class C family)